ncbi:MAG: hypothetical protein EU539_13715 [Promethearchaeota archaeon]|nr:MAG: hypothetical protein EU539_13715 [Candidatus Lokiarchaeota archaeon]
MNEQEQDEGKTKLIFIYNADSGGPIAGLKDTLHKTFRKSTYECNLCQVTFGAFGMKKDWKKFVDNLDTPVEFMKKDKFKFEFLHKDEFEDKYLIKNAEFPCAYVERDNKLELFISQDEMNAIKSIDELKELVSKKIKQFSL